MNRGILEGWAASLGWDLGFIICQLQHLVSNGKKILWDGAIWDDPKNPRGLGGGFFVVTGIPPYINFRLF